MRRGGGEPLRVAGLSGRQKIALLTPFLLLVLLTIGDRVWPLEHGSVVLAERYPERQRICLFVFWSFGPEGKWARRPDARRAIDKTPD